MANTVNKWTGKGTGKICLPEQGFVISRLFQIFYYNLLLGQRKSQRGPPYEEVCCIKVPL